MAWRPSRFQSPALTGAGFAAGPLPLLHGRVTPEHLGSGDLTLPSGVRSLADVTHRFSGTGRRLNLAGSALETNTEAVAASAGSAAAARIVTNAGNLVDIFGAWAAAHSEGAYRVIRATHLDP